MKTYIVQLGYSTNFYPPLTRDQIIELHTQYLFQPIRELATKLTGELRVKEELNLIGSMIVEASEEAARTMRELGFSIHVNGIKKTI